MKLIKLEADGFWTVFIFIFSLHRITELWVVSIKLDNPPRRYIGDDSVCDRAVQSATCDKQGKAVPQYTYGGAGGGEDV
jgi:hypothetical protein